MLIEKNAVILGENLILKNCKNLGINNDSHVTKIKMATQNDILILLIEKNAVTLNNKSYLKKNFKKCMEESQSSAGRSELSFTSIDLWNLRTSKMAENQWSFFFRTKLQN